MNPKRLLAAAALVLGLTAVPAWAGVDLIISIGVPPPAPVMEVVPPPRVGYIWVPGYWVWHVDRHVWIRGRWVAGRPGYVWVPERWEHAGPQWRLHRGYWERERGHPGRGYAKGHDKPRQRY